MAGGYYTLDPTSGLPMMQGPSGASIPLPLSEDELRASGLQLAPAPPMPPTGPDMRVAGPGGGPADWGNDIPALPEPTPQEAQQRQIADMRAQLAPAAAAPQGNSHATPSTAPSWVQVADKAPARPAGPGGVDPSTLARPGGAPAAPQRQGDGGGIDDPLVQQAMAEAMRGGGGGGGPRGLGITGETRKLKTTERGMDPALAAQAGQAQLASDGYNEQLAMSLQQRQQQAYEATQGEFAARAGQLAAAQERFQAKQAALADYSAKRDAAIEEARQLKTPQMEEYWGSRGTFTNVMTGLSIALGGALQGLRGGQNPGLEMSNQSIDRWLTAQREEYQRAERGIDRMDSQYARMVQQFGSEEQALEQLRLQAWEVRDGMLKSYAEKIGTPDSLEAYNQAMLASEAEKAQLLARASQGAEVEIEQKLSMQGGGGGRPKGVLDMLRAGAEAKGLRDKIEGKGEQPSFQREVQNEKVEGITGALEAIEAADEVQNTLGRLGKADDDFDNPLAGPLDYVSRLPGTDGRRQRQALEQQTALLARGLQQSLGKSDNDARLADEMAEGGGSGRQRFMAAQTGKQRAQGKLQNIVASLTPAQQQTLLQSLEANSPARAAQVRAAIAATATPEPAASEQLVR